MDRWLTLRDACMEFGLTAHGVRNLIKTERLFALRLSKGGKKTGALRILYPGRHIARFVQESKRHVEHVPLLSGREVAEALSIKPATVRQLKKRGHLRGSKVGNTILFTAAEIRRFLFKRERANRSGRKRYSPILAQWLGRIVDGDVAVDVHVLDTLLRLAVLIPEPMKSRYTTQLWDHFDAINELIQSARAGKDIPARFPSSMPKIQLNSTADVICLLKNIQQRGRSV
jgi:excisionase family DNA binding protein